MQIMKKQDNQRIFTYPDGSTYEGELQGNELYGYGIFTYPDGSKYEGEWKDGKLYGYGIFNYPDGSTYEVEWKEGDCHGKGILNYADGRRYEGQWQDGKKNGKGILTYPDGNRYEGQWQDGKKNGKGIYYWADGSKYEGQWQDGKIMLLSERAKKQNKTPTLLLRSPKINSDNMQLKYEAHKFLEGGEVVKVAVCENEGELFKAICKFSESNKNKDRCRLVFNQHGNRGGVNDMNINKESARMILAKLANDGIKNITISDLACHGGTAHHFIKVAQNIANIYKVNITVRYALEGRSCVSGFKWNNGDSRLTEITVGIGDPTPREKKLFIPESDYIINPKCKKLVSANLEQLR
jgi:hypothetical protein